MGKDRTVPKAADPSKSVANRVAQFDKSDQQLRDHRRNAALRESRTDEKGKENDQRSQTPKSNQKTNAEKNTPDAVQAQTANPSATRQNGFKKPPRNQTVKRKRLSTTTSSSTPNFITMKSQRWIMPDFQKSATRVSLSSLWKTWKPTKPPTLLWTTPTATLHPNFTKTFKMKKFWKSINSNLKTTVYTPTTLPCYQPRTSSPNFTNNLMKYILGVKKVPTRTGPRCAPSACHPC